jgi:hypothetical protein
MSEPRTPTLFTSRYGAKALIIGSGLAPIRTSIGAPRWPLAYEIAGVCPLLMPTRPMLKMDRDPYHAMYVAKLEAAGVEAIEASFRELSEAAGGRDLVLLCFEDVEKPGEWCHRNMFSAWWFEKTGQVVRELVTSDCPAQIPACNASAQLMLF